MVSAARHTISSSQCGAPASPPSGEGPRQHPRSQGEAELVDAMAEPRTLLELDGDAEGGQNLLRLPACLDGNNVVGLAVNEEDRRLCPEAGGDILRRNEAARIAEDAGAGP